MSSTASNGAVRLSPDEHLHSACRGGGWIKIKSGRRANARPVEWWGAERVFADLPLLGSSVGASLLAMAACQPTIFSQMALAQL